MQTALTALQDIRVDQLELDNPFWQFSLAQWKHPALQRQLLDLQDTKGYRINLLLLSMWMSFLHRDLRPCLTAVIEDSKTWHEQVVTPLRETRKCLPNSATALKQQIQACELQAEQIEQAILYSSSLKHCSQSATTQKGVDYDSLDWLIMNLSASKLSESDLSLLLQNCLPSYPVNRIDARIKEHLQNLS